MLKLSKWKRNKLVSLEKTDKPSKESSTFVSICYRKKQDSRGLALEKYPISIRDKIMLGPIDKYKKYNHFPWKFLLHMVLLAVTSYQVLSVV